MTENVMIPTNVIFKNDFNSSTRARREKIRFAPFIGSIFFKSNFNGSVVNKKPTWIKLLAIVMMTATNIMGATMNMKYFNISRKMRLMVSILTSQWIKFVKTSVYIPIICSRINAPMMASKMNEKNNSSAVFTSWLFATRPFLRSSSRRFGVAFSVFSPAKNCKSNFNRNLSTPENEHQLVHHFKHGLKEKSCCHEINRHKKEQYGKTDRYFQRESDDKNVHLRHGTRNDSECDID